MDGTEVLKTFARMCNIGIYEIVIDDEKYEEIKDELLRYCAHSVDKNKTVIYGIRVVLKSEKTKHDGRK